MPDTKYYRFRINAYSPQTMPMARLAKYMAELAELLGQQERVHFDCLEGGSIAIVHRVEAEAVPKVNARLTEAKSEAPDKDLKKLLSQLNKMLREDNGDGELITDGNKILIFPGRNERIPEPIGPFNQYTEIEGKLIRVGGKGLVSHALIQDKKGEIWTCDVTRELARELGEFLYGPPMRIFGEGRWVRESSGEWSLRVLRAKRFEILSENELKTAIEKIKQVSKGHWKDIEDGPGKLLKEIQGDDQGVS